MTAILSRPSLRQQMRHVGRAIYLRLPTQWRESLLESSYRVAGPLFRGFRHYELWRGSPTAAAPNREGKGRAFLTDLDDLVPLGVAPGRIAIHAHVYYVELADELAGYLRQMPFEYDLFVSVTSEVGRRVAVDVFRRLPRLRFLRIAIIPNRGRDMAPMLGTFGTTLLDYDFLAHIHTKKSLFNKGQTAGWRKYLLDALFGDRRRIRAILALLVQGVGLAYPQTYYRVPYAGSSWMANRSAGRAWCERLGVQCAPQGYFDFPAGSMFWARVDALRPLLDAGIKVDDFEPEQGQNDGTLAHVAERLLGIVVRDSGRDLAILRDTGRPSWSTWRLEQYVDRDRRWNEAQLADPGVLLVAFDICDTLLTRPLLDPEQIRDIVARNAGGELGHIYLRWRAQAEASARVSAGQEVELAVVIAELGRLAGLDEPACQRLLDLELSAERGAMALRPDAGALYRFAVNAGKRVVFVSEGSLPAPCLRALLARHGFDGEHHLYLASEVGAHKRDGALYTHIQHAEGVAPTQAIMVGDDEHLDLQVPGNLGWKYLHLMRPTELARAMHRLTPLIEEVECRGTSDAQLGLGLLVRGLFGRLHYAGGFDAAALMPQPDARSLGYAICGPLVVAFSQWLLEQARADGIERLYFLAREGQFLKLVYDRVVQAIPDAPASSYLVVSRRALNVPAVRTFEDVNAIARAHFGPAPLEDFVAERYGLVLDAADRQQLVAQGLWSDGQQVEVSLSGEGVARELLEALLPLILAQGERERPAILAYLKEMGIGSGRHAVVDVGFSGTIQRGLNTLTGGGVDGYYMATLANTEAMEKRFGVRAQGAYCHRAPLHDVPSFIGNSFVLEKLLSADDTQLIRYALDADGVPIPQFRDLSRAEEAVFPLRAQIRAGALQFVDEALTARDQLLSDFRFPLELAAQLFERFASGLSAEELEIVRGVLLDDHYCGRGLVT